MKAGNIFFTIIMMTFGFSLNAVAVTPAKDIAATINLNGFACSGDVKNINETVDGNGNKTITANCPDGKKYQINISNTGRVKVKPI